MIDPKYGVINNGTVSLSGTSSITGKVSTHNTLTNANINNTNFGTITLRNQELKMEKTNGKITGKITVAPYTNLSLKTLGDVEELVLGSHSSVKIFDLNSIVFSNIGDEIKTVLLSGENICIEDCNPHD